MKKTPERDPQLRKLHLQRETLKQLTDKLRLAVGGTSSPVTKHCTLD